MATMTPEQFDREKKYMAALAIARKMLKEGVIDEADFKKTEEVLRKKFNPPIASSDSGTL